MRLNILMTLCDRHTSGRREGDSHGYENFFMTTGVEAPAQHRSNEFL